MFEQAATKRLGVVEALTLARRSVREESGEGGS